MMNMETINLTVEGMSCGHCVSSIKNSVGALSGIGQVNVDLRSKKVAVEYDPKKINTQAIKDTIEDQGYNVK
jgi:copper chaperone